MMFYKHDLLSGYWAYWADGSIKGSIGESLQKTETPYYYYYYYYGLDRSNSDVDRSLTLILMQRTRPWRNSEEYLQP